MSADQVKKSKGAAKSRNKKTRSFIPVGESVTSYVDTKCRRVPGALVRLSAFRNHVRTHAKEQLERHYRWTREFSGFPKDIRVTRRTVCKVCDAIRPTADTCGDHYDAKTSIGKASFICGVVCPDEPHVLAPADDASEAEEGEVAN